ncbi:unnamed protein product [Lepeophtheirus salmonis]|uniref:(salmon louse) hypothetical protein n=1 Tax=Lepeophtheirus salmonis TaxID=72036 RepID=A0A7R8H8Q2_LEPSM|nr:unnamed protein product [Lepeophtheirus salmonis]CAF2926891.1 unnamed protein product [Lepeophtheirus salmonis]
MYHPCLRNSTSLMNNGPETSSNQVKSPAYSDISDDGGEDESKKNSGDLKMMKITSFQQPPIPPPAAQQSSLASSISSSSNNHFPFAPYIPSTTSAAITTTTSSSFKPEVSSAIIQNINYSTFAWNFPPYPPGIDPNLHVHLINSDPSYKAKFEKERSDKEKAFKEQLDREQREKDRRRSVGITPPPHPSAICKVPEDLRKHPTVAPIPSPRSMISVKPEFNVPKSEPGRKTPQTSKDEGAKPTMETRGPPPTNINPYGYLHPSLIRPPVGLTYEALAAAAASGSINPLLLSPNPYMPQPLFTSSYVSQHETSLRRRKKAAAAAAAANKDSSSSRKRTPSPASASLSGGLNRSRSPPPLRHVHTHTHTHFGLGYPLLHPPGGVPPPAAHTPFTPGAYPSHLLPPSGNKGSLPSGPLGQSFPPPPK